MARLSDPSSASTIVASGASRGRLLLVEDNTEIQLVASRILGRFGYDVSVADNGVEALEIMTSHDFDVVLMDGQMPKLDGCATTREIRRREGNDRHTPVIAMTANAMDSDRAECIAAGMDDYLTKPIRPDVLAEALARWVRAADASHASDAIVSPNDAMSRVQPVDPSIDGSVQLDQERLAILRDLDDGEGELLAALVDEFASETERQTAVLKAAASAGDSSAVEAAAHILKGSGSNLGATQLSALASRLEVEARAGSLTDAGRKIEALIDELAAVRGALEAEASAA